MADSTEYEKRQCRKCGKYCMHIVKYWDASKGKDYRVVCNECNHVETGNTLGHR